MLIRNTKYTQLLLRMSSRNKYRNKMAAMSFRRSFLWGVVGALYSELIQMGESFATACMNIKIEPILIASCSNTMLNNKPIGGDVTSRVWMNIN